MKTTNDRIEVNENDLKEIFSLLTSCTIHERNQIYDENSEHHYLKVEPLLEYSLTQEKREFALDAWQAVIYFLHLKGYSLFKAGQQIPLNFSNEEFID
jgi:hypothetical protein